MTTNLCDWNRNYSNFTKNKTSIADSDQLELSNWFYAIYNTYSRFMDDGKFVLVRRA